MNTLGERLQYIRKKNNLTQEKVAEALGISIETISRYENNWMFPTAHILVKLCSLYNCSADFILCLADRADPHSTETDLKDFISLSQKIIYSGNEIPIQYKKLILESIDHTLQLIDKVSQINSGT